MGKLSALLVALSGCVFDPSGTPGAAPPEPPPPAPDAADPSADPDDVTQPPQPELPLTAFRITQLALRDPHAYYPAGAFGACTDVTDAGGNAVNAILLDEVQSDAGGDGFLDLSTLVVFRGLDPAATELPVQIGAGDCTMPATDTMCAPSAGELPDPVVATVAAAGPCGAPVPGTTGSYTPALQLPDAPCFEAAPASLVLRLGGDDIPLTDVRVAASHADAGQLTTGVLSGFLSEEAADAITVQGGSSPAVTLSSLLPGGTNACTQHDARDLGPDGVTSGWYVYFSFTAAQVDYTP